MHVQSCCFANLNLLLFYRSHCRRHQCCFSFLVPTRQRLDAALCLVGVYINKVLTHAIFLQMTFGFQT